MENQRFEKAIKILNYALEHKTSMRDASIHFEVGKSYLGHIYDDLDNFLKKKSINKKQYDEFETKFYQVKNSKRKAKIGSEEIEDNEETTEVEYDATLDTEYDERSKGEELRDTNKKIIGYKYKILIHNQNSLEGEFTNEEMDTIYRLYSSTQACGIGMTMRELSRCFPNLTYISFKRILRAFNISKASISVAPHILEEKTEDEIALIMLQNKENNIFKKVEHQSNKYFEQQYTNLAKELQKYKNNEGWVDSYIDKIFTERNISPKTFNIPKFTNKTTDGKPLFVLFADTHFGKKYDFPLIGRGYNKDIAKERIVDITNRTIKEAKIRNSSEVIFIFAGDLVESCIDDGMHSGHVQEMDIFGNFQILNAVDILEEMLLSVKMNTKLNVELYGIPGNHDRIGIQRDDDKYRMSFRTAFNFIQRDLKNDVKVIIPQNNQLKIIKNNLNFFCQHGDTNSLAKQKPENILALHGKYGMYNILIQAHWHSFKVLEGTNYMSIVLPSVASADKYIVEDLGKSVMPGFVFGQESDSGLGFDIQKITLY